MARELNAALAKAKKLVGRVVAFALARGPTGIVLHEKIRDQKTGNLVDTLWSSSLKKDGGVRLIPDGTSGVVLEAINSRVLRGLVAPELNFVGGKWISPGRLEEAHELVYDCIARVWDAAVSRGST